MDSRMRDLNQLLLNFDYKQNFQDDDFYVGHSNYHAFELMNKWPSWEKNYINIIGEKYSGKSHLVNIFLKKFKVKHFQDWIFLHVLQILFSFMVYILAVFLKAFLLIYKC